MSSSRCLPGIAENEGNETWSQTIRITVARRVCIFASNGSKGRSDIAARVLPTRRVLTTAFLAGRLPSVSNV